MLVKLRRQRKRVEVRKLEIEWRGSISCAPFEMATQNDAYVCWGKVDNVELELDPLNQKCKGGSGLGSSSQNGAAGARFLLTNSGGQRIYVGGTYIR